MSSAEQPLISRRPSPEGDHPDDEDDDDDNTNDTGLDTATDDDAALTPASPTLFIYLLTLSAGISGLLFGYDTGVISSTLVSLGTALSAQPLTPLSKSIITSSTSLLALLISPFSSVLADKLGRKRIILLADALFAIGALVQACSSTVAQMVLGRSVVGMAVGAASFVVPLYIAELAPARFRGRLVTMNVIFITLGQVVAYVVGWGLGEYGDERTAWRWMVGLGALPAVVQAVVMVVMPETPRWLVMVGRPGEARRVVERVLGGKGEGRAVDATVKGIEIEVREESEGRRLRGMRTGDRRAGWMDSADELFGVRRNRRALAIACLLQGLQQLCGFNSLMYFSATIFSMLGFPIPTLTSLVVAVTNFVFTLVALFLIDRIGRRRILLWSIPFMVAGLLLAAYGFSFIKLAATDSTDNDKPSPANGAAVAILVSIMVYVAGYALGLGNVPWMQSELFALNVRSLGSGVATATNWGANFVIGLTFLLLMDALTPSWTFVLYAVICAAGYGLIWGFYPETAGLSLEEAANLLEDDHWGVR
ncbi:general substrate transporter [Parachaetomium inaequale]|uniref:General substrate transporter n=1 Tax=Parachaetomium inaequale TaxID=2588326 RepID=A0AAN6PS17_9PEZI|nr:general substrate transporter [Parachaetomium inaequale]